MRSEEEIENKFTQMGLTEAKNRDNYWYKIGYFAALLYCLGKEIEDYSFDYSDDDFEEIKELKEENARLKEIKDDFFKQAEISHQAVMDKNKIIEKLETVIQEIKQLVSTDYIKNKRRLSSDLDCLDNFMQKIEDKCNEVIKQ